MTREELIQNIKDIGQSLIDNAEIIAGDYRYNTEISITCYPESSDHYPYITVTTDFVPERFIERIQEV